MDKVKNTLTVSPCRRIPPPRNKMSHLFAISMFTFWLLWRPDLCLPFFDLCVDQTYMYLFLASCKNLTYVYLFFFTLVQTGPMSTVFWLLCRPDLHLPFFLPPVKTRPMSTFFWLLCKLDLYLPFFNSREDQAYIFLWLLCRLDRYLPTYCLSKRIWITEKDRYVNLYIIPSTKIFARKNQQKKGFQLASPSLKADHGY